MALACPLKGSSDNLVGQITVGSLYAVQTFYFIPTPFLVLIWFGIML